MVTSMSMSAVSVHPKYVFGCDGSILDSLHMLDDTKFVYIAGHNVVVHNLDDPLNQTFIPGSFWMHSINRLVVSHEEKPKYLAVCEKGERAQVTIYETSNLKTRKRILPCEPNQLSEHVTNAQEFLSCAFSPKQSQQYLITLSGEPDWKVIFWQWERNGGSA